MSHRVVDALQAVEVDGDDAEGPAVALRGRQDRRASVTEKVAVGHAGQRVVLGEPAKPLLALAQPGLGALALADLLAQPLVGGGQLRGARGHFVLEVLPGAPRGLQCGGLDGADAVGEGEPEEQRLQARADLGAVGGQRGPGQQADVAHHHRRAGQDDRHEGEHVQAGGRVAEPPGQRAHREPERASRQGEPLACLGHPCGVEEQGGEGHGHQRQDQQRGQAIQPRHAGAAAEEGARELQGGGHRRAQEQIRALVAEGRQGREQVLEGESVEAEVEEPEQPHEGNVGRVGRFAQRPAEREVVEHHHQCHAEVGSEKQQAQLLDRGELHGAAHVDGELDGGGRSHAHEDLGRFAGGQRHRQHEIPVLEDARGERAAVAGQHLRRTAGQAGGNVELHVIEVGIVDLDQSLGVARRRVAQRHAQPDGVAGHAEVETLLPGSPLRIGGKEGARFGEAPDLRQLEPGRGVAQVGDRLGRILGNRPCRRQRQALDERPEQERQRHQHQCQAARDARSPGRTFLGPSQGPPLGHVFDSLRGQSPGA